jgi:hypothetical protein
VLFTYDAKDDDELALEEDTVITVIEKYGRWWKGEVDGKCGIFPCKYVQLLSQQEVSYLIDLAHS